MTQLQIHEYLLGKKGVTHDFKIEWQWHRYQVGGKMFAAQCLDDNGALKYVTVKLPPDEGATLREVHEGQVIPGYYMNKIHWNSLDMALPLPDKTIEELLGHAYVCGLSGLTKKARAEIENMQ